jgi:tetratricopeptide (TPR) repeat protein
MKGKYIAGSIALALALASNAPAQLVAGSAEDRLFGQIESAASPADRLQLAQQFEREFPNSVVKVQILTMIMNMYNQQQDSENALVYAEKALAVDDDNVEALIALTYNLALTRQDIPKAIEYGERAVSTIAAMRGQEPPGGYTPEAWTQYLDSLDTSARGYLNYAETIRD